MRRILYPLSLALVVALLLAGVVYAQTQRFSSVVTGALTVTNDADMRGDVTIAGDLTAANASLAVDTINTTSDVDIAGFATIGFLDVTDGGSIAGVLSLTPATVITVTQAMTTFTPLGSLQPIAAAGAVSFGVINASSNAGDVIMLVNTGAQTITISDTTGLVLSGNAALGAGDSIVLGRVGSSWYQLAPESDN